MTRKRVKLSKLIECRKRLIERDRRWVSGNFNEDVLWWLTGGYDSTTDACKSLGVSTMLFYRDDGENRNHYVTPIEIWNQLLGRPLDRNSVIMWCGEPYYIASLAVNQFSPEDYSFNLGRIIDPTMQWRLHLMPCSEVEMDINA